MLALLGDPNAWLAFASLSLLEIVLGIDNIIFLSILVGDLPRAQQKSARLIGLALAMLMRIALLFSIVWLTSLTAPWFSVAGNEISGRDLVLILGGLFLLGKSVSEIHGTVEGAAHSTGRRTARGFAMVVTQIVLVDIVFSFDSVFTAVGMARQIEIMIAAVVLAVLVMMWLSGPISAFVERHPTVKILALAFLILVGVALVGEGLDFSIPKAYLYFAMAFSVVVEMINIRLRRHLDQRQ